MTKQTDYVAKMQSQMKKWDADVDALAAAGDKASAASRATYQECVKGLRANRDAANKTLLEMQAASQDAGMKMQSKLNAAWESMQTSLEKASADLRK